MATSSWKRPGLLDTVREAHLTAGVLEQVHDAVVLTDLAGIVRAWNPAAERIYGYPAADILGQPVDRLMFPEDRGSFQPEIITPLRAQGTLHLPELRNRRHDGSEIFVSLRLAMLRDEDGQPVGMVGCSNDVTAQRRARLALQRQREELRIIFDSMPASVWFKDRNNTILRANRQAAAVAGSTPEEVEGRPTADFFPGEADRYHRDDREVIETGRAKLSIIEPLQTASGERRWVRTDKLPYRDEHGTIVGVIVFAVDITDQKRAEEALEQARDALEARVQERTAALAEVNAALRAEIGQRHEVERRLELALWANDLGMWDHDVREASTVGDARWAELIGYPAESGKSPSVLYLDATHPDDQPRVVQAWFAHVRDNATPYYEVEHRLRTRSGAYRWVLTRGKVVERAADGEALRVIGTTRDVTTRKQMQEEASRRQAELAHLLRLHTANCVAGELAHEINQPLGAIANFANGLVNHLRQPSFDRAGVLEAAEHIATQALRAGKVLQRVREFIRKEVPEHAPTDLNRLIETAASFVESEAHRHAIAVHLRLAAHLPSVLADAVQIEQVLINLLRNGIESIAGSGHERGAIVVTSTAGDGVVEVCVTDSGPGVPATARAQLFDPFFTTKPQGLGMGLSISRSIIEAHGGRLTVTAATGPGATFCLTLPTAPVP